MVRKELVIDILFNEISSAFDADYEINIEKFEQLSQEEVDFIGGLLAAKISEAGNLGFYKGYSKDDEPDKAYAEICYLIGELIISWKEILKETQIDNEALSEASFGGKISGIYKWICNE